MPSVPHSSNDNLDTVEGQGSSVPSTPQANPSVTFHDLTRTPTKDSDSSQRKKTPKTGLDAGGTIVSSPGYMDGLREKQSRPQANKKRTQKVLFSRPNQPTFEAPQSLRKRNHNCVCPICKVQYKESPDGGDWVQCVGCSTWYHELCVSHADDPYFTCEDCLSSD